jgi:PAS domain S-box-containing protein
MEKLNKYQKKPLPETEEKPLEVFEESTEARETRLALLNMLEDTEEAKEKAEEEKNKTLAIINNFTDGLLVFDTNDRLSLFNPRAEVFFDIKARDVVERSISQLATFPTMKSLAALLKEKIEGVYREELKISEKFTVEVSTVPIIHKKEKLGDLVILHDITREKMVERMKTEFVSLAAHQLRTPLAAIKWTLRMLLDGDLGEITEEQKDFIEKTYSSNERMIALINDLLDVTRIEEGRYLLKPTPASLEDVVQFVIKSYQEEIKRRKIKLEFQKPAKKTPQVMIDAEKMRIAIQNLVDNAVKYTPPQGTVTVSLKFTKKKIELSVKDTGIGIPKDQQERVFTKFFRAANVIRKETEGSGLGLFIAKNIIEAHKGKIWFKSKEGEGTTFYFTLPVKEEFTEFLKEF